MKFQENTPVIVNYEGNFDLMFKNDRNLHFIEEDYFEIVSNFTQNFNKME